LERAAFAGATFDIKAQTSTAFPQQGPFDFLKKTISFFWGDEMSKIYFTHP
jgi:hypothetical protein